MEQLKFLSKNSMCFYTIQEHAVSDKFGFLVVFLIFHLKSTVDYSFFTYFCNHMELKQDIDS